MTAKKIPIDITQEDIDASKVDYLNYKFRSASCPIAKSFLRKGIKVRVSDLCVKSGHDTIAYPCEDAKKFIDLADSCCNGWTYYHNPLLKPCTVHVRMKV